MLRRGQLLRHFRPLGLLVLIAMATPGPGFGQTSADRVPGDQWLQFAEPSQAGFDASKLEAARQTWESIPSSAFMVISDGAVVAAWGEYGRRFMCHSVRKSFMSGLYGIYWDRGEIELNKTLADLGIDDEPDPLLETEKQARILDLLKARSGVFHPAAYAGRTDSRPRGSEGPGRYFAYNNWDFNTVATILMQETGDDVFESFDEHFGRPLQMEDWRLSDGYYHFELDKSKYPAYPFRMSARDAARFGLLYARNGKWGDERILSENWVRRSSALYSIDGDRETATMGYGLYWWILRDPRFAPYGAYTALGVGNQAIAVFPKLDMVIVNRANTYQGEGTPPPQLMDLMAQVLEARTGTAVANPVLVPLEERPDPLITSVSNEDLTEFVGEWDFPAPPLGLPATYRYQVSREDGYLVANSPVRGTYRLYLQPDGSLHSEDSYLQFLPISDDAGSFAGLALEESILEAAIIAAAAGNGDRAEDLLSEIDDQESPDFVVSQAVIDLLGGDMQSAEQTVGELTRSETPARVEAGVNAAGYVLVRAEMPDRAVEVFEFNTRVFPEAFNTWDSLGEVHMGLGHDEEAIRYYERSLELNPDNANAAAMIERIRAGEG
jgi:CubicO group peptidase (beta-lactamase class C family)